MAMSKITTGMADLNVAAMEPMLRPAGQKGVGKLGRVIKLDANHYGADIDKGELYHYDIAIDPDNMPKRVAREIFEQMLASNSKFFGKLVAGFDDRKNVYTNKKIPCPDGTVLEVVIPDARRDRKFRVAIKLVATLPIGPFILDQAAIQGLDIVFRTAMMKKLTPAGRSFYLGPLEPKLDDLGGGLEVS